MCVCVCNQGTEEDEQKPTQKSISLLESQHHHLLHCLEKTTVSALCYKYTCPLCSYC